MGFKETDRFFRIGTPLVLFFALTIGVLNVGVLYLFGLPILGLLISLFLVWYGKADVKLKAIVTLCIFPTIIIAFFAPMYLLSAEVETFLIPQNYRGEIVVFLDEECGQDAVVENGSRVYEIPHTGVLITKSAENKGLLNRKFYLLNEFGDRTEIPVFGRQNFETEKQEWHYYGRSDLGELTKFTVGAFWAYGSETYHHSRKSIAYRIYDYHQFENLTGKEGWYAVTNFGKVAGEMLDECRSKLSKSR